MTHSPGENTHTRLKQQLQPTAECIPTERFGEVLLSRDRNHLATCARCQTELALWQEFQHPALAADEHATRLAADLRYRLPWSPPTRYNRRPGVSRHVRKYVVAAASVGLVMTAGYVSWDPEPPVEDAESIEHTYRGAGIRIMSPVGELDRPPDELTWVAINGAIGYDVRVLEVDGTPLWEATSQSPRVRVPDPVVAQFIPGKTIVWDVTARNSAGVPVALSGPQRFRVQLSSSRRR